MQNEHYTRLTLAQLIESPTNPRKRYSEAGLNELADTIRTHGVIQPLVVRPHPLPDAQALTWYEIVAGSRRFRAAQRAGVADVPVRIVDLSDEDVLEIQVIENAQREDVHFLEEADGFQLLRDRNHLSPALIAEKIGKSQRYVEARLSLTKLIPDARERAYADQMTIKHAEVLAPLPEESQRAAFRYLYTGDWLVAGDPRAELALEPEPQTDVADLRRFVKTRIHQSLKSVPWNLAIGLSDELGPCDGCAFRSSTNPGLFPEAEGDVCTNGACFAAKHQFLVDEAAAALARKNKPFVVISTAYQAKPPEGVLPVGDYQRIWDDEERCEFAVTGLTAHADPHGLKTLGERHLVCVDPRCEKHHGPRTPAATGESLRDHDERLKVERDVRKRLFDEVFAGSWFLSPDLLRTALVRMVQATWQDLLKAYVKHKELAMPEDGPRHERHQQAIVAELAALATVEDLADWLIQFQAFRDTQIQSADKLKPEGLLFDAAEAHGVDAKAFARRVRQEHADRKKQRAKKTAKGKAAEAIHAEA